MLFPGAINGEAFAAWVREALAPILKPRDIVICDTLNVHKNVAVAKAIRAQSAELLFLPPYSPYLTPVEMLFAKIKTVFRNKIPRTMEKLEGALKAALEAVLPVECENYRKNSGYGLN